MSAEQVRAELVALLEELAGVDLSPQERHSLSTRINRLMPVTASAA